MSNLTDEAREARNAYYRKYRAEHKDKVRETNRKYWEKKKMAAKIKKLVEEPEECGFCLGFFDDSKDWKNIADWKVSDFPLLVASVSISTNGELELYVTDGNENRAFYKKLNYCPMCGKQFVKVKAKPVDCTDAYLRGL